ncbi:SDR family oxidoreductase [Dietzia sp. Alg238-R159]|uniref:NAD-dependent epimerase/dehydratase family protein n=1 Tax=Dietzia sp. Alg238-R159 TaxID=2305986 RepID=UPI002272FE42|nr:SDR family oxidoreductase [Dietzia sp. Alg238-R159]
MRDVTTADLTGFDAVIHLATLSPLPDNLDVSRVAHQINYLAAIRLAKAAREAGVARLIVASACPPHARADRTRVGESAPDHPLSSCAPAGAGVEKQVVALADSSFVPVLLRLADIFGASPKYRSDTLLNRMVGVTVARGEISVAENGNARRSMVHVLDVADALLRCLAATAEFIRGTVLDVGSKTTTVSQADIASAVRDEIPGATVNSTGPVTSDPVACPTDFGAVHRILGFRATRGIADGVAEIHRLYAHAGVPADDLNSRFCRESQLRRIRSTGEIDVQARRVEKMP